MKGFALGFLNFLLFICLSVLGLVITLNYTILNPDFVIAELDKLDTSSLIKEQIEERLTGLIPAEVQPMAGSVIDDAVDELEPWMKEQAKAAIYPTYDYFMGRSESLSIVISTDELKEILRDKLREAFVASPPGELAKLPAALREQLFDQYYQQFSEQIPPTFELSESLIPPEAMETIQQARRYIGYYQIGYKALIGLTALLVLLIIVISRSVRGIARGLGITCLVVGAVGFAEIYLATYFGLPYIALIDIPVQLQTWLPQLITDLLAPLQTYHIGLAAAGAVLLVISFAYKPRET